MRLSIPLTVSLFLLSAAPGFAALNVEATTPYQLRVVVRCGDHPDLTPQLRAELKRTLQGGIQAHLGKLGTVDVIDLADLAPEKWEPLWKAFDAKGFAALDSENGITGLKTHFVRIDHVAGQYEVRARQCDGIAGFVTPLVRTERTPTRGFVPRLAVLAIGRDLGLIGTLDEVAPDSDRVQVSLKGGSLGAPMNQWVRKGDIFAVIQIRNAPRRGPAPKGKSPPPTGPQRVGSRVDSVLLQAIEDAKGGLVMCRLFYRYDDPLPSRGGVLGYRCVKLGTTEAPLRLRLVDAAGVPHPRGVVQVRFRSDRFPERANEGEAAEFANGVFQSRAPLPGLALAQLSVGGRDVARIPIEIVSDQVVVKQVKVEPGAEVRGRLELLRRDLFGRITDSLRTQVRCFQDLISLGEAKKFDEALARAEATQKLTVAEEAELKDAVDRLTARAKRDLPNGTNFAVDCQQQLDLLRDRQAELVGHIEKLKEVIRIENDPTIQAKRKEIQEHIRQAELLMQQADYDKALARFDEAIKAIDNAEAKKAIQARRDALAKAWEARDGEHATLRKFVYEKWPGLANDAAIREALPEARKAFQKCKALGDRLTLSKLVLAATEVEKRLRDQIDPLRDSVEEEDQKTLIRMQKVAEDLLKFLGEVTDFLKAAEKKK